MERIYGEACTDPVGAMAETNEGSVAVTVKRCSRCRVDKPLTEFYISKTGRDAGRPRSQCKRCEKLRRLPKLRDEFKVNERLLQMPRGDISRLKGEHRCSFMLRISLRDPEFTFPIPGECRLEARQRWLTKRIAELEDYLAAIETRQT